MVAYFIFFLILKSDCEILYKNKRSQFKMRIHPYYIYQPIRPGRIWYKVNF